MNWIVAGLLMFASSVVLYLLIRKAALLHIPTEFVNFASFSIPLFLYLPLVLSKNTPFSLSLKQLMVILILSILGSYLPNVTSLKSIKFAPNPGYSLIISKSYVVFTTIAALFLFHSPLSFKAGLAILVIVGFSVLITVGKTKAHRYSNSLWFPFSLFSFFGWGFLSLGTKYAFTIGINLHQRLIYLAVFVSFYILCEIVIRKIKLPHFRTRDIFLLLCIGVASGLFNYFLILGLDLAPNIGYINAINASSISAVTVFSALIFKDDFSIRKFIGVLGVTGGLLLLIL